MCVCVCVCVCELGCFTGLCGLIVLMDWAVRVFQLTRRFGNFNGLVSLGISVDWVLLVV